MHNKNKEGAIALLLPAERYSLVEFPGGTPQVTFEFSFEGGYISQSHIVVSVIDADGDEVAVPFTWAGAYTITLAAPVATGSKLRIRRWTPKEEPLVNYSDGSMVSEGNLDTSNQQAIMVAAEAVDAAGLVTARMDSFQAELNSVQQPGNGSVARTVQGKLLDTVSVKDFGATGDGVTNDTAAINAALAYTYTRSKALYFPAGIYLYDGSGELGNGNVMYGDGRNATFIRSRLASPTDGYLIRALGVGSGIRGIRFDAAVAQTAGCYVWLSGPESFIEDFYMTGDFNGVWMTGNVSRIRHGRFQDAAAGAIRIKAEGGDNSQIIDDVLMGAQTPANIATAGIRVRNSSALMITNTSVIQMGVGLMIDPYSNVAGSNTVDTDKGNVFSLYANNCFFDNCTRALAVNPTATGGVYRCRFSNCWFSSSTLDGIYLAGNAIHGMHFESCHVVLNVGAGVTTGLGCQDIRFNGGLFANNQHGFYLNNGFSKFSVTGAVIGSGGGLNGNTANGIALPTGMDYVTITGNTIAGNATGIVDSSATANKVIFNNVGEATQKVSGGIDMSSSLGGQIKFPATQNASSDANTLDDYEEGTWAPVLTFATPGNLAVTYVSTAGEYTKIGNVVTLRFQVVTSAFTHTTASGILKLTGLPFASGGAFAAIGTGTWAGITKAGYTHVVPAIAGGTSEIKLTACGSGVGASDVDAGNTPTGGTISLRGEITYRV